SRRRASSAHDGEEGMGRKKLVWAVAAGVALVAGGAGAKDPSPEASLGTWQDRVQIEDTLQLYIRGFDGNDPQVFASAFAEDGVFQFNSDTFKGRAAIAKYLADRNAGRASREAAGQSDPSGRLFHVMTNSVITFEGPDKAHHSAYGVTIGRTSKEAHIS